MSKASIELVKNAAGRMVPTVVNGQKQVPFQGVGKYRPEGRKAAPRPWPQGNRGHTCVEDKTP